MYGQRNESSRERAGTEDKIGSGSRDRALSDLNDSIRSCMRCSLAGSSTHHVVGEGNPDARLFIVPQAPGEKEDSENSAVRTYLSLFLSLPVSQWVQLALEKKSSYTIVVE